METRPVTLDDGELLHRLVRDWEAFWSVPRASTKEGILEWLTAPSVDMASDTISYWVRGRPVAYGLVSHMPATERRQMAILHGLVGPEFRGRGIGSELLQWQMGRAAERLDGEDLAVPRFLRTFTYDWIEDASRLFRRHGMSHVRTFDEMVRPLHLHDPDGPPPGVAIERWDRRRDRESVEVNNRSFADHWGAVPMSLPDWLHLLDGPETRLDLSFMAIAGDELIGMAVNALRPDDSGLTDEVPGWIRVLSVVPEHRGRGVGTALMRSSFEAFRAEGFTHARLRVDRQSLTGANRLYESVGFSTTQSSEIYEVEL